MARRGRGSSARTKAPGRDTAVDGADLPGDEPGARTIGALALKRWAARGPGRGDAGDDGGAAVPTHGPFDEDDAPDDAGSPQRIDFGAVRVPVPPGGEVSVEPEDGRLQAVHVMLPAGRLSVSALAAPRTERLWPDLAAEIDESLREGGATVRSFTGEWGRELHARTGDASSLFVGVDGPRWMLYGVATGPTSAAGELDAALRTMLRGTVVVRGRSPYPVRTVLPLTVPDRLPHPGAAGVPVPRTPAERTIAAARPAPSIDSPTTITTAAATTALPASPPSAAADATAALTAAAPGGADTVPHGIPRRVPGAIDHDDVARPARGGPATPGPVADDAEPVDAVPVDVVPLDAVPLDAGPEARGDSEVTRTGSRGLFRRRPERTERPSARPPQRRVADLLAEAERDRETADRSGGGTPRTGRAAAGADGHRPVPGRRVPNGHAGDGVRVDGFVPRELTHDPHAANGASVGVPGGDGPGGDGARNGRSAAERLPYDRVPHEGSPYDRAPHEGSPYDRVQHDRPGANGFTGSPEPAGAAAEWSGWDRSDAAGHGASAGPATGWDRPDDRSREHHTAPRSARFAAGSGPGSGPGGGPGSGPGGDADLFANGTGSVGAIEATVWASLTPGGHPSTGLAPDGSDDWTLPLPVVRPEPEPVRPAAPAAEAPRGRRARREAAEREAAEREAAEREAAGPSRTNGHHPEPEERTSDAWAPESWSPGARTSGTWTSGTWMSAQAAPDQGTPDPGIADQGIADQGIADRWTAGRWTAQERVPESPAAGRRRVDRPGAERHREPEWTPSGAPSADRPRHAGGRYGREQSAEERPTRASRRARHTEEVPDPAGAARPRHRRPED